MKKKIVILTLALFVSASGITAANKMEDHKEVEPIEASVTTTEPVEVSEEPVVSTEQPIILPYYMEDSENQSYPFSECPIDTSEEPKGFSYYKISDEYKANGGKLPYNVQAYIYYVCQDYEINPKVIIAMIGHESGYRYNTIGDYGESFGYMQIQVKWHSDRLDKLGVSDILNPYNNILVGVDTLAEFLEDYNGDYVKALMAYNNGPNRTEKLLDSGIYGTEYTRSILTDWRN